MVEVFQLNIGDRIKEQRLYKSWTQEQLAHFLNVSRSTVSSWEVGRNYPDLETIVAISDLFEISLDKLLREDSMMVRETSKKAKHFKLYKIAFVILSIIVVSYIGYNQKLKHDETIYRANLQSNGWKLDTNPASGGNAYELYQNGTKYWTYILPAGFIGFPLSEQKIDVIVKKGKLTVDVHGRDTFEVILSESNDSDITFSAKVIVDQEGHFLSSEDKISGRKKAQIKKYLLYYQNDYKQMIHNGMLQRKRIIIRH